jgi:hypothetical protein
MAGTVNLKNSEQGMLFKVQSGIPVSLIAFCGLASLMTFRMHRFRVFHGISVRSVLAVEFGIL